MTTVKELEDTVANWIESVVPDGRLVYFENRVGPTPPNKYCLINLAIGEPYQWDIVTPLANEIEETVRGLCRVTFNISAIGGDNTLEVINRIRNSINASNRWTDLWSVMGKGAVGQINDLSSEYESVIRERHEFSFTGETALPSTFLADCFDHIDVTTIVNELTETVKIGTDFPPPHLDDETGC